MPVVSQTAVLGNQAVGPAAQQFMALGARAM